MVWKEVTEWVCFDISFGITFAGILFEVLLFIAHPEKACSLIIYEFQCLHLLHCPSVRCGSVVKPARCPHHLSLNSVMLVAWSEFMILCPKLWGFGKGGRRGQKVMPLYVGFYSNSGIVLVKLWFGSSWFLWLCFFLRNVKWVTLLGTAHSWLILNRDVCHVGWQHLYLTGDSFVDNKVKSI